MDRGEPEDLATDMGPLDVTVLRAEFIIGGKILGMSLRVAKDDMRLPFAWPVSTTRMTKALLKGVDEAGL